MKKNWMKLLALALSTLMVLSLFAMSPNVGHMTCSFSAPVMIPLVAALGSVESIGVGWRMHVGLGLTLVQAVGVIAAPALAAYRQYWLFLALQGVGMVCRIAVCTKLWGAGFVMSVWGGVLLIMSTQRKPPIRAYALFAVLFLLLLFLKILSPEYLLPLTASEEGRAISLMALGLTGAAVLLAMAMWAHRKTLQDVA